MNKLHRAYARASIGLVTLLAFVLIVFIYLSSSAIATDEQAIKDVIEASYEVYFEACKVGAHDDIEANKDALEPFWSAATRTSTELATRMAYQVKIYSTPLPGPIATHLAELRQTATANPTEVPAELIMVMATYVPSTPNWTAYDTPLDRRRRDIDICQEPYDNPDHFGMVADGEIIGYTYEDVDINGSSATVIVRIERSWEMIVDDGTDNLSSDQGETKHKYFLKKIGDDWFITGLTIRPNL